MYISSELQLHIALEVELQLRLSSVLRTVSHVSHKTLFMRTFISICSMAGWGSSGFSISISHSSASAAAYLSLALARPLAIGSLINIIYSRWGSQ